MQCHERYGVYRLRTAADTVRLIVTLLAHGCPLQAIVIAFGVDERTVAHWWRRAGLQGQAVQEHLVEQPRDLGHVQADEIRVKIQGGHHVDGLGDAGPYPLVVGGRGPRAA